MLNSCVIINRNFPPNKGVTGYAANELALFLHSAGIKVSIVTIHSSYDGGGTNTVSYNQNVYRINSIYNGKIKLLRLIASLIEGWRLSRMASSLNTSVIISMTDPPLLPIWVARVSKIKNIMWIYWSMDLYPDAFVACKLISTQNILFKILKNYLAKNAPNSIIALGQKQAAYLENTFGIKLPNAILPCGIINPDKLDEVLPAWKKKESRIIIGYVGNLGEAHDLSFLISVIEKINPTKHLFLLSVYGTKSDNALKFAKNKPGVLILPNIPLNELKYIDVHVVTLSSEWSNICIPSKAYTAISMGCSIILNCSKKSDMYSDFKGASWFFDCVQESKFKEFSFDDISQSTVFEKKQAAVLISKQLQDTKMVAFNKILSLIA